MDLIEVRRLYKVFGLRADAAIRQLERGRSREEVIADTNTTPAVIDANFSISQGEVFVVMGLSGSGKSTLVRCLNRLHEPTRGTVLIDGEDLGDLSPAELRRMRAERISMVFQHFGLFPHRTILENAAWGLEVRKVDEAERHTKALEALDMVGLSGWEKSYPSELSGGMQQRVGLARALATDADILLMDEAFSALDPLIRGEMQEQLLALQKDLKKTIVFITHDLNEAMFLGDRIAVMKDGRIVQIGTAQDILTNPADDYVRAFMHDVDRSRVLTAGAIMEEPYERTLARYASEVDEVSTVSPDTPLADLLVQSAESDLPLAVVEEGRLLGVVPQDSLLHALAGEPNGNSDPEHSATKGA